MDYPIHIDTISMKYSSPFCILRGCLSNFLYNDYDVFLSLKENSADLDEMPPSATSFHLGLQCLPK